MTDSRERSSPLLPPSNSTFSPSRSSLRSTVENSSLDKRPHVSPIDQPFQKRRKLSPNTESRDGNSSPSAVHHTATSNNGNQMSSSRLIPIPSPGSGHPGNHNMNNSPSFGGSPLSSTPYSPASSSISDSRLVHNSSFVPPPPLPIVPVRSPSPTSYEKSHQNIFNRDNIDPSLSAGGGKPKSVVPRVGRACLACRKLKTRCENADNPPCKRCRNQNLECMFVESKRGKRPPKRPEDQVSMMAHSNAGGGGGKDVIMRGEDNNSEKLEALEKTVRDMLESLKDGKIPGKEVLKSLEKRMTGSSGGNARGSINGYEITDSYPPVSTSSNNSPPYHRGSTSSQQTTQAPATTNSGSLSLLADATLAAELDGSKQSISGLDASFRLSSLTNALDGTSGKKRRNSSRAGPRPDVERSDSGNGEDAMVEEEEEEDEDLVEETTPGLFSKNIMEPSKAVDLFRIFFDHVYIHLPLLDPSIHTATRLCRKSHFLFTVVCAVAARFDPDPTLHVKCYEEAHNCFVDMVANGERSLESVQACLLLTAWCSAPKGWEDRPQRAWLYFGMAVRMGMELGLFRPPLFTEGRPELKPGIVKNSSAWKGIMGTVPEEVQKEALNRERTWLLAFVIDRYMSAVMGRPYQIHEVRPVLIPTHPMISPLDHGIIAHVELQSIMGQVMDSFADRIYGHSDASDDMPSEVVMKLFNSRMDEWKDRWVSKNSHEPIANNLLFYFYNSKLFLNTFPLATMLRNEGGTENPDCVAVCISSAKQCLQLAHSYANLGVLTFTPDVNFLYVLYSAVFLLKVKVSNSRFAQLVDQDELQNLMAQAILDCQGATVSPLHAAGTIQVMLKALLASWKAMAKVPMTLSRRSSHDNIKNPNLPSNSGTNGNITLSGPHFSSRPISRQEMRNFELAASSTDFMSPPGGSNTFIGAPGTPGWSGYLDAGGLNGVASGFGGMANGMVDPMQSFLNDTSFFDSILVSRGIDGFFNFSANNEPAFPDLDLVNHSITEGGEGEK